MSTHDPRDIAETLSLPGKNLDKGCTEIYRYTDGTIGLYTEDSESGLTADFDLDDAKALMAALGRLIWTAENPDED